MDPVEVLARIRAVPHGRVAAYSDITPTPGRPDPVGYFHPRSAAADEAIRCQVELQREAGGNSLIAGSSTR